jgi:long-subunit acyl-CoA synthetase (AMP-forming)
MLLKRAERWPDHSVLAYRDESDSYHPVSWSQFFDDMASVAVFLKENGVSKGDRCAVFSPNSYNMLVWEMAVISMGAVSVPIFQGYDAKNVDFILNHAEPKAIYVDGDKRLEKVMQSSAASKIPVKITCQQSDHTLMSEIMNGGSRDIFLNLIKKVNPNDLSFIQYTSGTTGNPKGVMLTHRNIVSQRKGMSQVWKIPVKSRFLSYLPWHHSFGGLFERFAALYHGATIHLEDSFGKDINRLIQNWADVKPTQFFSVPKIYIGLVTEARANPEIHDIIFHPELSFCFTAAAPLPRDCAKYFEANNVPVVEGWGLTETSPLVTFTTLWEKRVEGCIGMPIAGCEILVTDDGDILTRGPNLMRGYFKDRERTAKAIDELGWFHTGDLGELIEGGLRMTCRVDDMFKLTNGEKVSSMLIENAMTITSEWIAYALAIGAGEEFVAALVFPNYRNIERWAEQKGITLPQGWDISKNRDIQNLLSSELIKNMADFQPKYMRIKKFVIIPKGLTLEGGELTPTMKVIRGNVLEKYKDWCEAIFCPSGHPDKQDCIVSI